MDKDFVQKAILLPVITAVVLCAFFFGFMYNNIDSILPVSSESVLAYHDDNNVPDKLLEAENGDVDINTLSANDYIGTIKSNGELLLRYNADYSRLKTDASLMPKGSSLGEIGCSYIKIINGNANMIDKDRPVVIDGVFGRTRYQFIEEVTVKNEQELFFISPSAPKSIVIYYQTSNKIGLKSEYKGLIFEEVAQ